jgi:hypothetical protein
MRDALHDGWYVVEYEMPVLQSVLRPARKILATDRLQQRANLLAFLEMRTCLFNKPVDVAKAWALQLAREQLFRAELSVHDHGHLIELWDGSAPQRIGHCRCEVNLLR